MSVHATLQANERFPGEAFVVADEVNDGMAAGRLSTVKPHGLAGLSHPDNLYVWTPDRRRVYAVKVNAYDDSQFVVVTVMRPTGYQLGDLQHR